MRIDERKHPERAEWGKPLDGVRILAAEQMQALPYATQLMAHLGADVVKVEHPATGESSRGSRPTLVDVDGREVGATYLRNNLSKRSIGIDLKNPRGRDLFKSLAAGFDVVAENFKPGTMTRLGLGYAEIAAVDPRIVYVSVSGFGNLDESPYASWPAYAPIPEAMAGFYEQNRRGDERPRPLTAGALGDIGSAMFAVIGTLAALRHRERTGLGQHVDIAMYDAMIAMADMVPFMASMGAGDIGGSGPWIIDSFRAQDGYFVIEVIREHHLHQLGDAIGRPEWRDDERFAKREDWPRYVESIFRPAIEEWAATRGKLEVCHELCGHGVAAGPSNTADDLRNDPHVEARNMLIEVPRTDAPDPLQVVGNPVKLSRVAEGPVRRFPALGAHTDEVLRESLSLDDDAIAALRSEGVIP
jgi:crotonobetainyl-CoA:carnitine CoA-transferase CaiB-like acyl-CoA transferase